MKDEALVDKLMNAVSVRVMDMILNGMLYVFCVFIALVAFFMVAGLMGWRV